MAIIPRLNNLMVLKDLSHILINFSQNVKGMLRENPLNAFTATGTARLLAMAIMRFIFILGRIEG